MTIENRVMVPVEDILSIEVQCEKCGARCSLPIKKFDRPIHNCPNCNVELLGRERKVGEADVMVVERLIGDLKNLQSRDCSKLLSFEVKHSSGED